MPWSSSGRACPAAPQLLGRLRGVRVCDVSGSCAVQSVVRHPAQAVMAAGLTVTPDRLVARQYGLRYEAAPAGGSVTISRRWLSRSFA